MQATFVELRTKTREILEALRRNESVELSYRGRRVGVIQPEPPSHKDSSEASSVDPSTVAGFGSWADDPRYEDPTAAVREMRRSRFDDL